MKTAAKDLVCLDGTYGDLIECNQLFSCQPCDPRRIIQLSEGRLPKCTVSLDTKDRIEELVEHGRFSTTSDAVEIALEELIPEIKDGLYARRETRCEIMQVADAFRAKMRKDIGKRLRIPEFYLT